MSEYESRFAPRDFGGDYDEDDEKKMRRNQERVRSFMVANIHRWMTAEEIRSGAQLPPNAEVTARVRDLRKKAHGGWTVDCKKIGGVYRYRLRPREAQGSLFMESA